MTEQEPMVKWWKDGIEQAPIRFDEMMNYLDNEVKDISALKRHRFYAVEWGRWFEQKEG